MNSLFLLLMLLSSVVVDVTLTNGEQLHGKLALLSNDQVSMSLQDGKKQSFARAGVKEIRFQKVEGAPEPPKLRLKLTDQSTVPIETVAMSDGVVVANKGLPTEWNTESRMIQSIRWLQPNEKTDDQWKEIETKTGTDDLLVIRRQSLDYLQGVVLGITSEAVKFEYSGSTIPVPLARVAGVMLSKQEAEQPTVRLHLTTRDGGAWMLANAELDNDLVRVTTAAGAKANLPIDSIVKIKFPQLGATFVTDLEPENVRVEPLVSSTVLADTLKKLNAPKYDVGFDGLPLCISSSSSETGMQSFQRGLAIQSQTEMVYRLAKKYRSFMATAGVSANSASNAEVELTISADEREVFRKAIRSGDEPVSIDVDVSEARRLKLMVNYGANIDIGDRLHLGDARLVK